MSNGVCSIALVKKASRFLHSAAALILELGMADCRTALIHAVREISLRYQQEEEEIFAILLSGGVDTAALLEANHCLGLEDIDAKIDIKHAVTVLTSDLATDRPYAAPVAVRHSVPHHTLDVSLLQLLELLPFCVKTLKTFDGMTLRNSIVIAMALNKAKDLGATIVLTGDGADELMGGYSYTWGTTDEAAWVEKRNDLAVKMNFCTGAMASALGLKAVASPFLVPSFIEWVTTSTSRADCITEMPIELSPTTERIMHITGKVCLRNAFPESPSAHRRKDPIEMGSGATNLNISKGGADFFGSLMLMPPTLDGQLLFETERDRISEEQGVVIKDLEHLFYYREFLRCFPPTSENLKNAGLGLDIDRFAADACIGCGYQLRKPDDLFCYVCGAWPARVIPQVVP